MIRNRKLIGAVTAGIVLLGAGTMATAGALSDDAAPRYDVEVPEDATPAQRRSIERMQTDAPIPVQDSRGVMRGYVRDSSLTAGDDRVVAKLMEGFREPRGPEDEEYSRLFEALRLLDPVPVVDDDGRTVGYFTSHFVSLDEYPALREEAQATVDALLGS